MRWPDVQKVAVSHLATALAPAKVATKAPVDLETAADAGFVRVRRGPGGDDGVTDSPLLDVETFTLAAASAGTAWDLAESARQAALDLAGKVVAGALVDSVTTAGAPTLVDYQNPKLDRYVASYRLNLRRVTAS